MKKMMLREGVYVALDTLRLDDYRLITRIRVKETEKSLTLTLVEIGKDANSYLLDKIFEKSNTFVIRKGKKSKYGIFRFEDYSFNISDGIKSHLFNLEEDYPLYQVYLEQQAKKQTEYLAWKERCRQRREAEKNGKI